MSNNDSGQHDTSHPHQHVDEVAERLRLVNRFNMLLGVPDPTVSALQARFVTGNMTDDDMVGFAKLYKYVIDGVEKVQPSDLNGSRR